MSQKIKCPQCGSEETTFENVCRIGLHVCEYTEKCTRCGKVKEVFAYGNYDIKDYIILNKPTMRQLLRLLIDKNNLPF